MVYSLKYKINKYKKCCSKKFKIAVETNKELDKKQDLQTKLC